MMDILERKRLMLMSLLQKKKIMCMYESRVESYTGGLDLCKILAQRDGFIITLPTDSIFQLAELCRSIKRIGFLKLLPPPPPMALFQRRVRWASVEIISQYLMFTITIFYFHLFISTEHFSLCTNRPWARC